MKKSTSLFTAFAAAVTLVGFAGAQDNPKCGPNQLCPEDAPCCSQFGQCGAGAYCLGGCNPMFSHKRESCTAAPVCKSSDYKLTSLDDVSPNTQYLGDSSKANWVSDGKPQAYDGAVLFTMPPSSSGTVLSSTHYIWYGKVETTMKTSRGQGVVTAFILMSDVRDEIDFEFVGEENQQVQSNYYWQGNLDYTKSKNISSANTDSQFHTYAIDWNPDTLTWSVDGQVQRTLKKADTFNTSTNSYQYPQTPSRIQLSLWPAGDPKNGQGTVDWAGGPINWNSPYMQNGYYSAQVSEVKVECYDPPQGVDTSGTTAYSYKDLAGLDKSVAITNDNTILASLMASGENSNFDPNPKPSSGSKPSASSSGSAPPLNTNVATVPGGAGVGGQGSDATQNNIANQQSNGGTAAPGASGGTTSVGGGTNGEFNQNLGGQNSGSGSSGGSNGNFSNEAVKTDKFGGSAFAVIIAVIALVMFS